jgi:hypothetical protein
MQEEFPDHDSLARSALPRSFTPLAFGIVLFILIVAIVVLSPSTESRFIYTDF